jgi:hypothetical protein
MEKAEPNLRDDIDTEGGSLALCSRSGLFSFMSVDLGPFSLLHPFFLFSFFFFKGLVLHLVWALLD